MERVLFQEIATPADLHEHSVPRLYQFCGCPASLSTYEPRDARRNVGCRDQPASLRLPWSAQI